MHKWGGLVEEIRKGDVDWIPAGIKHWHGATATGSMTHIAFTKESGRKAVDWLEKVSHERYDRP